MIVPIVTYPDDRLTTECADVVAGDHTGEWVRNLIDTMHSANGWGLAAPQIGILKRVFVVHVPGETRDPIVMINPQFVTRDGMQLEEEGCLSLPGFEATVVRPTHVVVKGLDRDGNEHQHEGTGLLARAFQHEMDHLDGTLFIDHLRGIKRDLIVRRIKKLTRAGKW